MGSRSVFGMSALRVVEPSEARVSDPVVAWLDDLLGELAGVVADGLPVADADRIDRLDRLTRVRAAVVAAETAEIVRFARSQTAQQLAADVHPRRTGRGIAAQIALVSGVAVRGVAPVGGWRGRCGSICRRLRAAAQCAR